MLAEASRFTKFPNFLQKVLYIDTIKTTYLLAVATQRTATLASLAERCRYSLKIQQTGYLNSELCLPLCTVGGVVVGVGVDLASDLALVSRWTRRPTTLASLGVGHVGEASGRFDKEVHLPLCRHPLNLDISDEQFSRHLGFDLACAPKKMCGSRPRVQAFSKRNVSLKCFSKRNVRGKCFSKRNV